MVDNSKNPLDPYDNTGKASEQDSATADYTVPDPSAPSVPNSVGNPTGAPQGQNQGNNPSLTPRQVMSDVPQGLSIPGSAVVMPAGLSPPMPTQAPTPVARPVAPPTPVANPAPVAAPPKAVVPNPTPGAAPGQAPVGAAPVAPAAPVIGASGPALSTAEAQRADYSHRVGQIESGNNPNVNTAAGSSATGLFQITDGTWKAIMQNHPNLGLTVDGRGSAQQQQAALGALTQDNAKALALGGQQPTPGNLYLAHFAGAGGAVKVLRAPPNTPVEQVLGAQAVASNKFLQGKTTGDLIKLMNTKMAGVDPKTVPGGVAVAPSEASPMPGPKSPALPPGQTLAQENPNQKTLQALATYKMLAPTHDYHPVEQNPFKASTYDPYKVGKAGTQQYKDQNSLANE